MNKRYIWRNALTGHWMVSASPAYPDRLVNRRFGKTVLGFRRLDSAWEHALSETEIWNIRQED